MSPENFVLWLNGFVEMTDAQAITEKQWKMIKEHLALCVTKVTQTVIKNVVGPIVAEPAKPIEWKGIFPQPFTPFYSKPVPTPVQPIKWWDEGEKIWLSDLKPIC